MRNQRRRAIERCVDQATQLCALGFSALSARGSSSMKAELATAQLTTEPAVSERRHSHYLEFLHGTGVGFYRLTCMKVTPNCESARTDRSHRAMKEYLYSSHFFVEVRARASLRSRVAEDRHLLPAPGPAGPRRRHSDLASLPAFASRVSAQFDGTHVLELQRRRLLQSKPFRNRAHTNLQISDIDTFSVKFMKNFAQVLPTIVRPTIVQAFH